MREAGFSARDTRLPCGSGAQLPAFQVSAIEGLPLGVVRQFGRRVLAEKLAGSRALLARRSTCSGLSKDRDVKRKQPEPCTDRTHAGEGLSVSGLKPNAPAQVDRGRTDALQQGTMRPRKLPPGDALRRWCPQSSAPEVTRFYSLPEGQILRSQGAAPLCGGGVAPCLKLSHENRRSES